MVTLWLYSLQCKWAAGPASSSFMCLSDRWLSPAELSLQFCRVEQSISVPFYMWSSLKRKGEKKKKENQSLATLKLFFYYFKLVQKVNMFTVSLSIQCISFPKLHLCPTRQPLSPRLTFLMIVPDRGFTFRGPAKDNQKRAWSKTLLAARTNFQSFLGLGFLMSGFLSMPRE